MKVHLSLNNRWVQCRAGARVCPREYHLDDVTVEQANLLPRAFMDQLVADPREKFEYTNGMVSFYYKGFLHSIYDKPSKIDPRANGGIEWHKRGRLHRLGDKPARIRNDGVWEWHRDGKPHRDGDKPALESDDGTHLVWAVNGMRHREGGLPSAVYRDGSIHYWVNNRWLKTVRPGEEGHSWKLVEQLRASATRG